MTDAPKIGRPPKPPSEKQSKVITVKVTDAEFRAAERKAGNVPVATWARQVILRAAKR